MCDSSCDLSLCLESSKASRPYWIIISIVMGLSFAPSLASKLTLHLVRAGVEHPYSNDDCMRALLSLVGGGGWKPGVLGFQEGWGREALVLVRIHYYTFLGPTRQGV